jgi:hypothetical protein
MTTPGFAQCEAGEAPEEGAGEGEDESRKRKREAFPPGLPTLVRPDTFAYSAAAPSPQPPAPPQLPPPPAPPPPPQLPPRSRRPPNHPAFTHSTTSGFSQFGDGAAGAEVAAFAHPRTGEAEATAAEAEAAEAEEEEAFKRHSKRVVAPPSRFCLLSDAVASQQGHQPDLFGGGASATAAAAAVFAAAAAEAEEVKRKSKRVVAPPSRFRLLPDAASPQHPPPPHHTQFAGGVAAEAATAAATAAVKRKRPAPDKPTPSFPPSLSHLHDVSPSKQPQPPPPGQRASRRARLPPGSYLSLSKRDDGGCEAGAYTRSLFSST